MPAVRTRREVFERPRGLFLALAGTLSSIQPFSFSVSSRAKFREEEKLGASNDSNVGKLSITFAQRVGISRYPSGPSAQSPLSSLSPGDQVHLITGNGVVF